jgi:hypothetical protein
MTKDHQQKKTIIERAGEDLFDFATDRDDVKWLLAQLSNQTQARPATVDHELQMICLLPSPARKCSTQP